ncbi:hypothetical protein [Chthonobacter rhizosphaerae]|uniref:hypothetical protein n=1 Tax=Chthonobacter rhizosphaerae TaxID=2735553 RepID=UPI001AEEB625|nr:hypothetical protein [Chthonobacter rhizosphaerae]
MHRHRLLRLLAVNGLAGSLAGLVVVGGLLALNVGGLGSLVAAADNPVLPVVLMTVGFVVTLASVAMGSAVMRIGSDEDERFEGRLIPIRIEAEDRRRRRR